MSRQHRHAPGAIAAVTLALAAGGALHAFAQAGAPAAPNRPGPPAPPALTPWPLQVVTPTHSLEKSGGEQNEVEQLTAAGSERFAKLPVSKLHPGGVNLIPSTPNPVAHDPDAVQRGMRYFNGLNCVGCHAPNGGGGMGPSLSNRIFIYGSEPSQIYLSIVQGRPYGMPSWGSMLPDSVVWDLVAYVQSISQAPTPQWGTTISPQAPSIEQVPAEFEASAQPWSHTEPFSHGQNPEGRSQ